MDLRKILATSITMGGVYVRRYVGCKARAIAISLGEASKSMEPNIWSFLKWQYPEIIRALILYGE